MSHEVEEIRINDYYTSHIVSEYESGGYDKPSLPKARYKNIRTAEWLEKLQNHINPEKKKENEIIPQCCRYINRHKNGTLVAIEEQPAMRSIRVDLDMFSEAEHLKSQGLWKQYGYENFFNENKRPYVFNLAMPYVIHIMSFSDRNEFSSGKIYFRPKPLLGMNEILFKTPFLNVSSGQGVCYGDSVYKGPHTSLAREIDHVLRVFWSATFNSDYIQNYDEYNEIPCLTDYFTWQYYSKINPMFVYTAEWIPTNTTLDQIINDMKQHNFSDRDQVFGYQTLHQLFKQPSVSDKTVEVGRRKVERNLIYDIANGYYPTDSMSYCVYLGDPLMYSKNRVAYIDSFIGISGISNPQYIRLQIDDKLVTLKLSEKVRQFIKEKTKEIREESSIEIDGVNYEAGDIISMKNKFGQITYKKLHYIRKSVDGKLEMRIGSAYWFVDQFEWKNTEKVDMQAPVIEGVKIEKDKIYYMTNNRYSNSSPLKRVMKCQFSEVMVSNNKLHLKFTNMNNTDSYTIDLSTSYSRTRQLFDMTACEKLEVKTFVIGRTLCSLTDSLSTNNYIYRKDGELIIDSQVTYQRRSFSLDSIYNDLISEDGQRFSINTNVSNLNFEIGEKVVVVDWENPLEMLRIKTITGFVKNHETQSIEFVLQDKNEKLFKFSFIDVSNGIAQIGKIRKVTNELDGITIGTKIIAKEARISCFPKKNVNIIIAFIVDTGGEPLVLCSNGCTLWFSDLINKFDLITIKDEKWKTLEHAELDQSKIKIQPGDIITTKNGYYTTSRTGHLAVKSRVSSGMRVLKLDNYHEYDDYLSTASGFMNNVILDCIPNPRYSVTQQDNKGFVFGIPNFHGGLVQKPNVPYQLIDETGRF